MITRWIPRGDHAHASCPRAPSARWLCFLLFVSGFSPTAGCATWDDPSAARRPNGQLRDAPDDRDPETLVPVGVQTVIDVDMAQVRRSPWVIPALEARDRRTRAAKDEALGYDDVNDVDRVIYAVTAAGADAPTLVIAQGRFQTTRVQEAFRVRWPAAVVDRWRGIVILASGENAIALLTARTFASGTPATVRSVIDRAFGIGADVSTDPALGPTRRALCPEGPLAKPALLAAIAVDDRIRARVGDTAPVPRELRQVGLRVDLGQSLDLRALGILDDRESAVALARRLNALLTDPIARLTLRAMGLAMLLPLARVATDGARVLVRLPVDVEHRAQLSSMLKMVVESSRNGPGPGGLGSW
ncbi:MAG: hypothetical protein H7X95_10415 [Deltaproteobacteria bacterium]|nr:hypothetical protein [Deltaproteobacteria bacterium]